MDVELRRDPDVGREPGRPGEGGTQIRPSADDPQRRRVDHEHGLQRSQIGIPNCDAYTASKGATVALARSMAVEYGPRGMRVNGIAPAAIPTPMLRESNPAKSATFDEDGSSDSSARYAATARRKRSRR